MGSEMCIRDSCLTPPIGHTSTIVVPINADQFAITEIIAHVSIY